MVYVVEPGDEVRMCPDHWDHNSICDLEETLTVTSFDVQYVYVNHPQFTRIDRRFLVFYSTRVESRKRKVESLLSEDI